LLSCVTARLQRPGVNHEPQSAAQRSENCSKHEGAGPSIASRTLREPPAGTDCVSGQSSRSLGRRRCSAEHGTPRHCSVGHPSPARARRRSMQTHAQRVKQDRCSTDDIRPKHSSTIVSGIFSVAARQTWPASRPPSSKSCRCLTANSTPSRTPTHT
jgi:hypothetical protein